MYKIDNQSRIAVYEQIINQVEKYVIAGILIAGDKMPSVRKLSVELNVNPNTVQRAYTELERSGVITTSPKRGAFVSDSGATELRSIKKEQSMKKLRIVLTDLKLSDVSKKQILDIVKEIFDGGEQDD